MPSIFGYSINNTKMCMQIKTNKWFNLKSKQFFLMFQFRGFLYQKEL